MLPSSLETKTCTKQPLRILKCSVLSALLFPSVLFSIDKSIKAQERPFEEGTDFWFTGPLLTPSGACLPEGHFDIEPYVFYTWNFGNYTDDWGNPEDATTSRQFLFQPLFQFGLNWGFDVMVAPTLIINNSEGSSSVGFGDLPVIFGYQLIKQDMEKGRPDVRITLTEVLPTGLYERLNPHSHGNDAFGGGVFDTTLAVILARLFVYKNGHALNTRCFASYGAAFSMHIAEFNSYGGGYGTKGRIYPGNTFRLGGALEYSFTQRWVFALDGLYIHNDKTRFSGRNGRTAHGEEASNKAPSSEQISFAPAIEYNFTKNLGLIGGAWFTVAGRNSSQFVSATIALNYYH